MVIVAIVLTLVSLRILVSSLSGAMALATAAASTRSAIGTAAIVAIVLTLVP